MCLSFPSLQCPFPTTVSGPTIPPLWGSRSPSNIPTQPELTLGYLGTIEEGLCLKRNSPPSKTNETQHTVMCLRNVCCACVYASRLFSLGMSMALRRKVITQVDLTWTQSTALLCLIIQTLRSSSSIEGDNSASSLPFCCEDDICKALYTLFIPQLLTI